MRAGFVVVTDSRKRAELLFMVDRKKQKASFWSDRLDDVMVFAARSAAEGQARALRFNNPRVMTLAEANRLTRDERKARDEEADYHAGMACVEFGWDGHKDVF